MRMGVFFGGAAMRGPAGVSDAVGAVERLQADYFFQVAQLAFGAADLKAVAVAGNGDSGGVVAAILELRRPSMMTGTTCFFPTYPTMPHIGNWLLEETFGGGCQ